MLDRPKLADLVIPDLGRWKDWSVMDRLVELFKKADEESIWVRVPVISYLRACPLPKAKLYIEELAKIDPDAVKRASLFPFGGAASATPDKSTVPAFDKTPAARPKGLLQPQTWHRAAWHQLGRRYPPTSPGSEGPLSAPPGRARKTSQANKPGSRGCAQPEYRPGPAFAGRTGTKRSGASDGPGSGSARGCPVPGRLGSPMSGCGRCWAA